jgi:anti-sigma factor RsiW
LTNNIPAKDLERLSAYLDGALDARQASQLEQRLKVDSRLSDGLRQLNTTRAVLRQAPQRRVPRNFTLLPAIAGAPARRGWSFSMMSAAATLLLVVVLIGDYWASQPVAQMASQMDDAAPEALAAPLAEMATKAGEASEEDGGVAADSALETGQPEMFAEPAEDLRTTTQDLPTPFDLRLFLLKYGTLIELGLVAVAAGSGLAAWRRRPG